MNYLNLILSNNSILRTLQIQEFKKYKLNGDCIEFGSNIKINRNFLKSNSQYYKTTYSNIIKNKNFVYIDLQKKINHKKKYDHVIIFNVLEHLLHVDVSIKNLHYLLKKNGKIIGSTPFIYRIHGAPEDYNRYTKQLLEKILKKNKFDNIEIKELGSGPFLACISLLRGYLKYIPVLSQLLTILAILIDNMLSLFSKNNLREIYPIGYIFRAKKK